MIKLKSLLTEQSSAWETVQANGTDPKGPKRVGKNFISTYKLINPDNNLQFYAVRTNQEINNPMYIGAYLVMGYNSNIKVADTYAVSKNRFDYYLKIFLAFDNSTDQNTSRKLNTDMFDIRCNQYIKGFNFSVDYNRSFIGAETNQTFKALTDPKNAASSTKDMSVGKIQLEFAKNPAGYAPGLIKDINAELIKYGFPALPSTFNLSAPVALK